MRLAYADKAYDGKSEIFEMLLVFCCTPIQKDSETVSIKHRIKILWQSNPDLYVVRFIAGIK